MSVEQVAKTRLAIVALVDYWKHVNLLARELFPEPMGRTSDRIEAIDKFLEDEVSGTLERGAATDEHLQAGIDELLGVDKAVRIALPQLGDLRVRWLMRAPDETMRREIVLSAVGDLDVLKGLLENSDVMVLTLVGPRMAYGWRLFIKRRVFFPTDPQTNNTRWLQALEYQAQFRVVSL